MTCRVNAALALLALVRTGAHPAPFACVPHEGSATVSVMDTMNDRVVDTWGATA